MPRWGKGNGGKGGKGGKGNGGGGGGTDGGKGGNGNQPSKSSKKSMWQCKKCRGDVWSSGGFCTGCGGSKSECKRTVQVNPNITKLMEENRKIREEFDKFKKDMQKQASPSSGRQVLDGGGGQKGNGAKGAWSKGPPPLAAQRPVAGAAAADDPPHNPHNPPQGDVSRRAPNTKEVWVEFDGANVTLATLHDMLEYNKKLFPESHPRIKEIRDAIARGHRLRSENMEPEALVTQTERNIANKERAIDKIKDTIARLKAQRDEVDRAILTEEAKLNSEVDLLQTFQQRLQEAKDRKKAKDDANGSVFASCLDKAVGMPTLRKWLAANYPQFHEYMEEHRWQVPMSKCHADSFVLWREDQATVNSFARYSSSRSISQIDETEVQIARKALERLIRGPVQFMEGCAEKAVSMYREGRATQPFEAECPLLLEWAKPETVGFAAVRPKSSAVKRMSGPYLLPKKEGEQRQPLQVQENVDFADMRQQARVILKDVKPVCFRALVDFESKERDERPSEQIKATDHFCAAVVQHTALLGDMPSYDEYIEEVCPKRFRICDDGEGGMEAEAENGAGAKEEA